MCTWSFGHTPCLNVYVIFSGTVLIFLTKVTKLLYPPWPRDWNCRLTKYLLFHPLQCKHFMTSVIKSVIRFDLQQLVKWLFLVYIFSKTHVSLQNKKSTSWVNASGHNRVMYNALLVDSPAPTVHVFPGAGVVSAEPSQSTACHVLLRFEFILKCKTLPKGNAVI